ncbi:MAG TPA: hypothetical protein VII94_04165 [Candidatus Saccharimonadales bacterium]
MKYPPLHNVICSQCNKKIEAGRFTVTVKSSSSTVFGCDHSFINIDDEKISYYFLYWITNKELTYSLEAHSNTNETELCKNPYSDYKLIKTFDYVLPLPIKDGVLEIDKLIQRLLNMKAFY